jgi:hypothetical protein
MFKYQIHALAMRKLGFSRPLRLLFLLILVGCLIAGAIYLAIVLRALDQRSSGRNAQHHSTR